MLMSYRSIAGQAILYTWIADLSVQITYEVLLEPFFFPVARALVDNFLLPSVQSGHHVHDRHGRCLSRSNSQHPTQASPNTSSTGLCFSRPIMT